ncbi:MULTISPECIES: hypothetical protein [unclassified Bacillus (in: firmicutes)]|uniref:hypothetical protein n=1 Tax=unclassified Bacillus (in: firmicutes) TaxID=185979 RepID=UPI001BEB84ED|nr:MULTISPECIES: hypothetical protein [unclassified Bacillus (in: firmicutes)]MBT2638939.1 hypothetical protein [Bacillus sp. ISL-39]MBT2659949.1 hypothetical protein [Bacillus sp. ISL-45]
METKQVTSFVLRFQLTDIEMDSGRKYWRVKVTHVQEEKEAMFDSLESAMTFIKEIVGES